jgi:hypothetical protein
LRDARDKFMTRNIKNGKSAQFPVTWKVVASYHTPGNEIVGQTSNANEKVIVIDDLLIAPVFIADIDEAKSHFEVRSSTRKSAATRSRTSGQERSSARCSRLALRRS